MASFEQHLSRGGEYLRQDRVNDARDEFLSALELHPDDGKVLARLGLCYFRLASFGEALPVYQKLVELEPNDASYWLNLGLVHLKLGEADRAIEELSRSRDLDPSQTRTVSYIGLAHARNGEYDRAYEAFLQAGQNQLAQEMEQYLSEEEREAIRDRVARGERPPEPPETAGEEEPPEEEGGEEERAEPAGEAAAKGDGHAAAAAGAAANDQSGPVEPSEDSGAYDGVLVEPRGGILPPSAAGFGQDGRGMVTQVIEAAAPFGEAAVTRKAATGHEAPQSLSEFATSRLVRPEDGEHTFEIGAGGVLIVRVEERVMSRTEEVIVSGGELGFEPATRRVRGASTDDVFGEEERRMFIVTGHGYLVASPAGEHFTAVALDDDVLYLRENLVFAFEQQLRWESGHVPGSDHRIHVVQFRGQGSVAMRTRKPLLSVKLATERVLYVDAAVLAGWIGRVVPRLVAPAAGGESSAPFVECSGEGVVLVEDQGLLVDDRP